uniref:Uncharacterized protein n=1 Tax=Myotis myotis TaxID=51298 RepID=A0A7J7ZX86_MYOMY|nr:hypothetical protein mMyoMyo1_009644 [Myotis myotis]
MGCGAFESGTWDHSVLCGTSYMFPDVWDPWFPPGNVGVLHGRSTPTENHRSYSNPRLSLTRFLRLGEGTELNIDTYYFTAYPSPTFSHVIMVGDALLVNRTAALPQLSTSFLFFSYTPSVLSLPLPLFPTTLNPLASPVGCTFKCLLLVPCPHSCPTIIYSHSSPRRCKKITASQPSVSAASEAFQVTGIKRRLLSLPSKAPSDLASSFILPTAPATLPSHSCLRAFPCCPFYWT